jgi:phage shock protein A
VNPNQAQEKTVKLFERVTRLVKSDAHGILDHLEERELLLKQHLRDAEIEVAHQRARAEGLADEQRRLRAEADRLRARETSLDQDVELALAGGQQDLARFAVERLLPVREARREIEARVAHVAESRDRLCERLVHQEEELADLKLRVQARLAEVRSGRAVPPEPERHVAKEEIELELLRRSRRRAGGAAAANGSREHAV